MRRRKTIRALPLPACGERHRRPSAAVLNVKNADAEHRLCREAIRVRGAVRESVRLESPPHLDPLPASGEREPSRARLNRRAFMTLLGGAALMWPRAARAQQPARMQRIGILMGTAENDPEGQSRTAAFQQALQKLGWTDGRNVRIEFRWPAADPNRMRASAAELVGLTPDVIVVNSPPILAVLQQETRSLPIVFVQVSDPVGSGFVASLAHPGGNTTGFTTFEETVSAKWLELLKEAAPRMIRVAIIRNPATASASEYLMGALEAVAPSLGVKLTTVSTRDAAEIDRAFDAFAGESIDGLIVMPDPITLVHREQIVALAARHRLPAVYPFRYFATSGGLISYGPNPLDMWRRAALYVDRILKGAKPADLPVQNPTKFELVINLKTAKALGLEVPPTVLARADEVIE
jgi:putative ABC transport system substrate-binding protein